MTCLRVVVKDFDPEEGKAFEVLCVIDTAGALLCRHCTGNNSICHQVAGGIQGDCDDLNNIIEIIYNIFFTPYTGLENEFNWEDDDFCVLVAGAVVRLVNIFDQVEKAHRIAWNLTGVLKKQAGSLARYSKYLEARRTN